jgi:hypothetical protein
MGIFAVSGLATWAFRETPRNIKKTKNSICILGEISVKNIAKIEPKATFLGDNHGG